jgi:hypothetical protein
MPYKIHIYYICNIYQHHIVPIKYVLTLPKEDTTQPVQWGHKPFSSLGNTCFWHYKQFVFTPYLFNEESNYTFSFLQFSLRVTVCMFIKKKSTPLCVESYNSTISGFFIFSHTALSTRMVESDMTFSLPRSKEHRSLFVPEQRPWSKCCLACNYT